jgi:chemotaxis protein methyltransferase CheR
MVYRRFSPRLKKLGLKDFGEYCKLLDSNKSGELSEFSNLITTNLTAFFREKHHFEYLATQCLPELVKKNAETRKIRIWSAGCSTGEEPYSIAILLREIISDLDRWDARILATDLDTTCIARAKTGIYSDKVITDISESRLKRWFVKSTAKAEQLSVKVKPQLQSLIAFKHLNLVEGWPFSGQFDIIFCRNVMIYFDKATQKTLLQKFARHQSSGDSLIIGHSENIGIATDDYTLNGQTVYLKR